MQVPYSLTLLCLILLWAVLQPGKLVQQVIIVDWELNDL